MSGADLTGADLREVDLTSADLTSADLTGADLYGAILTGAILTGADLSGADLTGADLREVDLTSAILTSADLREVDLTSAILTSADLRGVSLYRAILAGVDLAGVDLTGVDLTGVDLREVDLRGASLYRAILAEADLTGADLTGADLAEADLTGADLTGADLREVDLHKVDLHKVGLYRAILTGADLTGARGLKARARQPIEAQQTLLLTVDLGPHESPESLSEILAAVAQLARLAVTVADRLGMPPSEPGSGVMVATGRSDWHEVSTLRLRYGSPFMVWLQDAWTAVQPWVVGGGAAAVAGGIVSDVRKGPENSGLLDLILTFARPTERRSYLKARERRWEQKHRSVSGEVAAPSGAESASKGSPPGETEPILVIAPIRREELPRHVAESVPDGNAQLEILEANELQPILDQGFSVQVCGPEGSESTDLAPETP